MKSQDYSQKYPEELFANSRSFKPVLFAMTLLFPVVSFAVSDSEFEKIRQAQRQVMAHTVKSMVAQADEASQLPSQENNGDEARYGDYRGNFGKGLAHLSSGYQDPAAYQSLVKAVCSGTNLDFNDIFIGQGVYRLVNPQASLAYSLAVRDSWLGSIAPAPTFTSAEAAGEMVELYWSALVRDVNFNDFDTNPTVGNAVNGLNALSAFYGPKENGLVTRGTFLRGVWNGDLIGPYISQFLYLDIPYGSTTIGPNQTVPTAGISNDFNTTFADWFQVVTGGTPSGTITFEPSQHFIRTPRDLGQYVHKDTPGQVGRNALLILLLGTDFGVLDPGNPYIGNPTQQGFSTYSIGEFVKLIDEATQEALKAAWYQKWQVNRRLRPEEFGFYLQQQLVNGASLGIQSDLITASVLPQIFSTYGSYFLPGAYPEGSPVHPAYPAGHATFVGAVVTILKALFDENYIIPNPVEPNAANTALVPYTGDPLTVGNELNKLASNIALGRDHAGVHYRSDGYYGMLLGEQVAINLLNNDSFLFNENFNGFTLTKFDGTTITVGQKRTP